MKSLNLATEELPGLEVAFPNGDKKVITRKKLTPRVYSEWSKRLEELNTKKAEDLINDGDYAVEMILHVSDGVSRDDLLDLDMGQLRKLGEAVRDLLNPESPTEKKSESVSGTTPDSSAVDSPTPS